MATTSLAPQITHQGRRYILNARPDTVDFRDCMYVPTLAEMPLQRTLEEYRKAKVRIRDQGADGGCAGYALATVADYLVHTSARPREVHGVSARMLHTIARRYAVWPGDDGSSARDAMKTWYQDGACSGPGGADKPAGRARSESAAQPPLGAYYRIARHDLGSMHESLTEVGVLYATGRIHAGWSSVMSDGIIRQEAHTEGPHAFAIVGYDNEGFWIQNSWGTAWGKGGFGKLTYADWLANGTDIWVARLGVLAAPSAAAATLALAPDLPAVGRIDYQELRPHIVSLREDGAFECGGHWGNTADDIRHIFSDDFTRLTAGWQKPRLMLFAHGGDRDEASAVERAQHYRDIFLPREIYPLSIIWPGAQLSAPGTVVAGGASAARFDEVRAHPGTELGATMGWEAMQQNALGASIVASGGLHQMLALLPPEAELHLIGRGAGGMLLAYFAQALARHRQIESCTLWVPACRRGDFAPTTAGWVQQIQRFCLFLLADERTAEAGSEKARGGRRFSRAGLGRGGSDAEMPHDSREPATSPGSAVAPSIVRRRPRRSRGQ